MEDDAGERSSFVIGLIENRAKEVGVAAFDLRLLWLVVALMIPGYDTNAKYIMCRIEAEKGVVITNHSLLVTFNGSFDHTNIDSTRTRLLRANLLQPLKDIETPPNSIALKEEIEDELMSNEQLFFGLSQALRKFPKETVDVCFSDLDRVLCHFCSRSSKRVTNEVLASDNGRAGPNYDIEHYSSKTALDALPLLSKLNMRNKSAAKECWLRTALCLEALMDAIREDVSVLTVLSEVLCLLDMMGDGAHWQLILEGTPFWKAHNDFIKLPVFHVTVVSAVYDRDEGDGFYNAKRFPIVTQYLLQYMENLSALSTMYPNVKILHFDVDVRNNRMDFKFQLADGSRHVPHYGLIKAGVAGLPSSVVETAKIITSRITEKGNEENGGELQTDEDSLREALKNLKESYIGGRL
ncbi:hypothetical protein HAX54_036370 [Datura stramonium]|uniref:Uncharacterized protein n=1 Tax=Datura stramonium TaxID=4076 RepID=A0ABS8VGS8_DATST|nr:hypothetical protein [Datura stramonium]